MESPSRANLSPLTAEKSLFSRNLGTSEEHPLQRVFLHLRRWLGPRMMLLFTLSLAALLITRRIGKGEFNFNDDETQHAMTGMYFYDVLRDRPLHNPIEYTYEYYARYPALGLIHWPPFFHMSEGVVFCVLRPSVIAARLTVLLFALLGLYFWFRFVAQLHNKWIAFLATTLLALSPIVLLYEKVVMLEIPSLSLCIAATYYWNRYLRTGTVRPLWWFALYACAALLTKQTSIYLVLFCLLSVAITHKWHLLFRRSALIVLATCILVVGPYYALDFAIHRSTVATDVLGPGATSLSSWAHHFTYYWQYLPLQLGWPLLALSVLGIATCLKSRNLETTVMLMWILSCYITFTFIPSKTPRFNIYWVPAFIYFATVPILELRGRASRVIGTAVLVCLLIMMTKSAWNYQRPYVAGYAPVASRISKMTKSGVILFDGALAGNFIFFMRCSDPDRSFVILRKGLYAVQIQKDRGSVEIIKTQEGVRNLIREYGIRFIVVTENAPLEFQAQQILRDVLRTSEFKVVETFGLDTNERLLRGQNLVLYENLDPAPVSARYLRIQMLTLPHDIVVPLK